MPMNNTFTTCDCCGTKINFGSPFISIVRNVEVVHNSIAFDDISREIADTDPVLFLCTCCGNKFNVMLFRTVMQTLPCDPRKVAEN